MKKVDKMLQYADRQGIKVSKLERLAGFSNGYLTITKKNKTDISDKQIELFKSSNPKLYEEIFDIKVPVAKIPQDNEIELLQRHNKMLEEQLEFYKQKFTAIEKSLSEARRDQLLIASVQQAYQSWWIDNCGPKGISPSDIRKTIARKSLEALKSFEKEGISIG